MRLKNEKRLKERDDTTKAWKEVRKGVPLYMVKEQEFKDEKLLPELEARKNELEKIRNFYRPIEKKEMQEHLKQYKQTKKANDAEIRRQRELN